MAVTGPEAERVEQLVLEINVRDLDTSLATYTALGFDLERRDGGFAALRWGDRRLFLSQEAGLPPPPDGVSRGNLRIVVPDVDRVWSVALELGLAVEQEVGDRYYGLRDFTVLDPDGFGLRFASLLPFERDTARADEAPGVYDRALDGAPAQAEEPTP